MVTGQFVQEGKYRTLQSPVSPDVRPKLAKTCQHRLWETNTNGKVNITRLEAFVKYKEHHFTKDLFKNKCINQLIC